MFGAFALVLRRSLVLFQFLQELTDFRAGVPGPLENTSNYGVVLSSEVPPEGEDKSEDGLVPWVLFCSESWINITAA